MKRLTNNSFGSLDTGDKTGKIEDIAMASFLNESSQLI